jgi:hypothetical protein
MSRCVQTFDWYCNQFFFVILSRKVPPTKRWRPLGWEPHALGYKVLQLVQLSC